MIQIDKSVALKTFLFGSKGLNLQKAIHDSQVQSISCVHKLQLEFQNNFFYLVG